MKIKDRWILLLRPCFWMLVVVLAIFVIVGAPGHLTVLLSGACLLDFVLIMVGVVVSSDYGLNHHDRYQHKSWYNKAATVLLLAVLTIAYADIFGGFN